MTRGRCRKRREVFENGQIHSLDEGKGEYWGKEKGGVLGGGKNVGKGVTRSARSGRMQDG